MAILALPWLNAIVWAQSGDADAAKQLLLRVHARPGHGLAVPGDATSIFVQSFAGRDGDGLKRNVQINNHGDVQRLLADLRSLRQISDPGQACNGEWWPRTATITTRGPEGVRTFAARFDGCGLVVSGTGTAAETSHKLRRDIEDMVPNSGL